jgi:hypothetical protein
MCSCTGFYFGEFFTSRVHSISFCLQNQSTKIFRDNLQSLKHTMIVKTTLIALIISCIVKSATPTYNTPKCPLTVSTTPLHKFTSYIPIFITTHNATAIYFDYRPMYAVLFVAQAVMNMPSISTASVRKCTTPPTTSPTAISITSLSPSTLPRV